MLPDTAFPDPAERGYEDDPMHVERGATPDGRLLLSFTFRTPEEERHGAGEGDGAAVARASAAGPSQGFTPGEVPRPQAGEGPRGAAAGTEDRLQDAGA